MQLELVQCARFFPNQIGTETLEAKRFSQKGALSRIHRSLMCANVEDSAQVAFDAFSPDSWGQCYVKFVGVKAW